MMRVNGKARTLHFITGYICTVHEWNNERRGLTLTGKEWINFDHTPVHTHKRIDTQSLTSHSGWIKFLYRIWNVSILYNFDWLPSYISRAFGLKVARLSLLRDFSTLQGRFFLIVGHLSISDYNDVTLVIIISKKRENKELPEFHYHHSPFIETNVLYFTFDTLSQISVIHYALLKIF